MKRKKGSKIGASGDYAKFEIAVIKQLAKLLKQPYKKTQELVNTDDDLLQMISKAFDEKKTVKATAQALKEKLVKVTAKNPLSAFVELLSKLPKKKADEKPGRANFPMKLPATVTIGANKHKDTRSHNTRITVISGPKDHWKGVIKSTITNAQQKVKGLNYWLKIAKTNRAKYPTAEIKQALQYKAKEVEKALDELFKIYN